nr:hypothetical protein [Tanacetum cinerariifolium]
MVQKSGIQCYNCKEFGHVAKECHKPKRAKDAAYHREKMLLCFTLSLLLKNLLLVLAFLVASILVQLLNRGKAIVNSPQPIYDQEPSMVDEDDETSKDKEIDKLMTLISLSFKKIYKPTNNNLRTSSNTSRANQDNSPRINRMLGMKINDLEFRNVARECQKPKRAKDAAYHREKMLLCKQEEAGIQLNAEQADWRNDTDDDELEDQELEAHYMYMAQLQQVSPDAADSGPIFDDEPLQKVSNDDYYNVFAIECQHLKKSKPVHKTYLIEQDAHNVSIESVDMNYDSKQIDQNDEDVDLA